MKKFLILLFLFTCEISFAQIAPVNCIDSIGKRQGYWIVYGRMQKNNLYANDSVVEEGNYLDNQKIGLWISYYPNGNKKNEFTYEKNRPNGHVIFYNERGVKTEEGMWRNQRWIGTYKMYYTNDSVRQIIHYDSLGKKTGLHEEYYSDGKLMLKTNYTNGYANGWRTFYNDSGRVYKREFYSYDIIDTTQTKIYPPVPISPETNSLRRDNPYIGIPEHGQVAITGNWKSQDSLQKLAPDDTIFHYVNSALRPLNCDCDTTSLQRGSLNHQEALTGKEGYWILFQNGQIRMKGFFHLYKLVCGVNCVYDANGQLIQIKKYKDGKYIGDAPLPADANK